jgi:hypothetical protein
MDEPYGLPQKRSRQARQSRFARYHDDDDVGRTPCCCLVYASGLS